MNSMELHNKIKEVADKLESWLSLDGCDEWTEYVSAMIVLSYRNDMMEGSFEMAFLESLQSCLDYYNENATIVEKEITRVGTYNEIEWSNR